MSSLIFLPWGRKVVWVRLFAPWRHIGRGNTMKNIHERIAFVRKEVFGERGLSALARATKATPGMVQRWERGSEPQARYVDAICRATKCDPGWLLSGEGEPFPKRVAERAAVYQGEEPQGSVLEELERVTERLRAAAAAGKRSTPTWREGDAASGGGEEEEYRCIPYKRPDGAERVLYVHRGLLPPEDHTLDAVVLPDGAMSPAIWRGSICVYDCDERSPSIADDPARNKRIVAAFPAPKSRPVIRFLSRDEDGLLLTPLDPSYERLTIDAEAIRGRVVFAAISFQTEEG